MVQGQLNQYAIGHHIPVEKGRFKTRQQNQSIINRMSYCTVIIFVHQQRDQPCAHHIGEDGLFQRRCSLVGMTVSQGSRAVFQQREAAHLAD